MLENYKINELGIISQINIENFVYDKQYIQTYNNIQELTKRMSYLRLGYLLGSINTPIKNILDCGYGNGAYLEACNNFKLNCFGTDISTYPVPENCKFLEFPEIFNFEFDVISFFDCIEHIQDLSFISKLKTKYIYISLPWCHYNELGDEWFLNWKHRKPNEHLHHFNDVSLKIFMESFGYECIKLGNPEDSIRSHNFSYQNILTGIFKK